MGFYFQFPNSSPFGIKGYGPRHTERVIGPPPLGVGRLGVSCRKSQLRGSVPDFLDDCKENFLSKSETKEDRRANWNKTKLCLFFLSFFLDLTTPPDLIRPPAPLTPCPSFPLQVRHCGRLF